MAIECPALVARDQCGALNTSRYTTGRIGYTGAPIPQAIVLHKLVGQSAEAYNDQVTSPLPKFQCMIPSPTLCHEFPATVNPKSVHFLVTPTYAVQYAEITATTFGIDYLLGATWPGLSTLYPITDVNGPWIHIIVEGECANTLIELLCCIGLTIGRSLPIIAASDLQVDRPEIVLNPSIQEQVDNCVASGGFQQPPNIFDLESRVTALELCCTTNRSDIVVLKSDLSLLTGRVSLAEQAILVLKNQVLALQELTAIIPTLVAQITILINQIIDIQNNCCPTPITAVCFRYQLLPGSEMIITPNQPVWLNLPTRVEDRDDPSCQNGCLGPIVHPGPLWSACLEDCTWALTATVRFRLAQWCSGKKASLYLVACGKKYLIAEQIITSTAPQSVTFTGTFLLPPGCCDVHLLVATNDDKITSAKVVEFAEFKGCCA